MRLPAMFRVACFLSAFQRCSFSPRLLKWVCLAGIAGCGSTQMAQAQAAGFFTSSAVSFGSSAVGTAAPSQSLIYANTAAGSITWTALTMGAPNLDFQISNTTCGPSMGVGGTCQFTVTFKPTAPGTRYGAIEVLNATGAVAAVAYLSGTGLGPLAGFTPGTITTVAGNGTAGFSGDNGPATSASLYYPYGVAVDGAGNLYIGDGLNHVIRKVPAASGNITTIAGNNIQGYSGDGGIATSAELYTPNFLALDGAGNVYVTDGSGRVRMISAATGIITTVAGNGSGGYSGDGGAATDAAMSPATIAVDGAGNLYIVDEAGCAVREVTASTGIISTLAGSGVCGTSSGDGGLAINSSFAEPVGIAVDGSGNIFISDQGSERVREVSAATGIITTVAGTGNDGYSGDGGPATSAELWWPEGIALDGAGDLYIADYFNLAVRKVMAGSGIISTVAGNGLCCDGGDGGSATSARFSGPYTVALDSIGNIYVADYANNRTRKVSVGAGSLAFAGAALGSQSPDSPLHLTLTNNGTTDLSLPIPASGNNPTVSSGFTLDAATTCPALAVSSPSAGVLAAGASCAYAVDFISAAIGSNTGSLVLSDNSNGVANSTQSAALSGTGTLIPQTISFAPITSPVTFGTGPITLSATGGGSGNPVTFSLYYDYGGTTAVASISGNTVTILGVRLGTITVAANQAGNATYAAAPQVTQSFRVLQAPQTITFSLPSQIPFSPGPIPLTATGGGSLLPVTFVVVSGPGRVSGNSLALTGLGTVVVRATEIGNQNYLAATPVTQTVVVTPGVKTINFTAPDSPAAFGSTATLSATASNGDPVVFSILSGAATLSGTSITYNTAGTVVIAADSQATTDYAQAAEVTYSVVVSPAPTSTSITAPNITYGANGSALVSVTSAGGTPAGNLSLTVDSGPALSAPLSPQAPVALWPFDDPSGTSAADTSGNGNNGTVNSGATLGAAGHFATAISLDGATGYVSVADAASLDISGSLSVESWINAAALNATGVNTILSKANPNGGNAAETNYSLQVRNATLAFAITFNGAATLASGSGGCDASNNCYVLGATPLTTGLFHHAVGVYNDATKAMQVYLDGVLDGTATFSTAAGPLTNAQQLVIGNAGTAGTTFFNGIIDETRVWNRALGADEVLAYADATAGMQVLSPPAAVAAFTIAAPATGAHSLTANYAAQGNFDTSSATGGFTVNQAAATVNISNIPAAATYGGSFTPTLAYNGDGTTSVTSGTRGTCTVAGGVVTFAGAGSCTLTAQATAGTNYAAASGGGQSFQIGQASASVTPNAASKTYGAADPVFTGTLSGFLASDNVTATYSRTGGETVGGGPYTISVALAPAAILSNYNITYNTALFTINKATAIITVTPYSVAYDGSAHSATGTATGVGGASLNADLTLSGTTHTTAGTYPTDPWSFTDPAGNYNSATGTVSDKISKAAASIAISNIPVNATAGGSFAPVFSYTGDGVASVTSSTATCTVSAGVVSFVSAGTCTLTAQATAGTNYAAATGSPQSFSIAANTTKTATLTPAAPNFGSIQVGTGAGVLCVGGAPCVIFTLTNTGSVAMAGIGQGAVSGDASFAVVRALSTCGPSGNGQLSGTTTLNPGAKCVVTVQFRPLISDGVKAATLSVSDSFGTQTASMTGTATALATVGFSWTNGGTVGAWGTASGARTITVTNNGATGSVLALSALPAVANLSGGSQFARTGGTCSAGSSLSNGRSCTVIITRTRPATKPAATGSLTVTDTGGAAATQTLSLSGN